MTIACDTFPLRRWIEPIILSDMTGIPVETLIEWCERSGDEELSKEETDHFWDAGYSALYEAIQSAKRRTTAKQLKITAHCDPDMVLRVPDEPYWVFHINIMIDVLKDHEQALKQVRFRGVAFHSIISVKQLDWYKRRNSDYDTTTRYVEGGIICVLAACYLLYAGYHTQPKHIFDLAMIPHIVIWWLVSLWGVRRIAKASKSRPIAR